MKKTTALILAILTGLSIFLASAALTKAAEEDTCLVKWKKCWEEVMKADTSVFVTIAALTACDLEKIYCYLFKNF